ncbi:NUDIX domain-containing protein [Candidatus Micrarchaeota archaeon]|nr:NUDIX domain-containing protein [Candidatus Micrarchaeota archaeon]
MVEQRQSVGVVLYRQNGPQRQYLVLHYAAGHWDFPKGGVEQGESEEQTLRRELLEETGISDVQIHPGFRDAFSYFFREKGELVRKTVSWFIGKTAASDVKLSFEHKDFAWLSFQEAMEKLTHKNAKQLLEKAAAFLTKQAT